MDNLLSHTCQRMLDLIEEAILSVGLLSRYSLNLNPIETSLARIE